MYGTQAVLPNNRSKDKFENDVNMYGTQAYIKNIGEYDAFENDVNMYGTQAVDLLAGLRNCLGMM